MRLLSFCFLVATIWPGVSFSETAVTSTTQPIDRCADAVEAAKLKPIVTYCHDGDTCRVKLGEDYWFSIRLAGIDAPEVKGRGRKKKAQPFADQAKTTLNDLVKDKTVTLVQTDLDPYNRPVAVLFVGEDNINLKLIQQGLAEVYRGKTKRLDKAPYLKAESEAKAKKLGIWGQKTYVSPKEFRKNDK